MTNQLLFSDSKQEDLQQTLKDFIYIEIKKSTRNTSILFDTFKKETQEIKDKIQEKENNVKGISQQTKVDLQSAVSEMVKKVDKKCFEINLKVDNQIDYVKEFTQTS